MNMEWRTLILRIVGSTTLVLFGVSILFAQSARPAPSPEKVEAFSEAARGGDVAAVRKLLDEGVDVNTKYRYDRTALSFACDRGHLDVVKLLLDRGADVNIEDTFYHATPLTWAVSPALGRKPQHAEIAGLLLKHGAKGKEGALLAAVGAGELAMTKAVLDNGNLQPGTLTDALESATRGGKQEIAALLERAGAKPRVEFKIDAAELARFAGTYRGPTYEVVLTVSEGRLTGTAGAQKLSFIARDPTTFGIAEAPGLTAVFRVEGGNVTAFSLGQGGANQVFTRVQGR